MTTARRTAASGRTTASREPASRADPGACQLGNQAEIYFAVAQRKVLALTNFPDLDMLEQTLLAFRRRCEQIAQPFEWKFTRKDRNQLLERLEQPRPQHQLAA